MTLFFTGIIVLFAPAPSRLTLAVLEECCALCRLFCEPTREREFFLFSLLTDPTVFEAATRLCSCACCLLLGCGEIDFAPRFCLAPGLDLCPLLLGPTESFFSFEGSLLALL